MREKRRVPHASVLSMRVLPFAEGNSARPILRSFRAAVPAENVGDGRVAHPAALTYPLLVENALPPSSIAPEHPLLPRVTVGSRNVRASIPTIQVRL